MKYLGITLTKICKTFKEKIYRKILYCKDNIVPNLIDRINTISIKSPIDFLKVEPHSHIPKFMWKYQEPKIAKPLFERINKFR